MEIGDPTKMVEGWRDLSGKGPYLILVKPNATLSEYGALRELLKQLHIEALLVPADLFVDVRRLSRLVLEDLQRALSGMLTTAEGPVTATTPLGTRVKMPQHGLTGELVEHRPQNNGVLVRVDNNPSFGGFAYSEVVLDNSPPTIGLTPERVVAALQKRPDLLEGVRRPGSRGIRPGAHLEPRGESLAGGLTKLRVHRRQRLQLDQRGEHRSGSRPFRGSGRSHPSEG